jgi:hypothetical protein
MNSDQPKDPIVERMASAREARKAQEDVATGERKLAADFQKQANRQAPQEVANIEAAFADRCQTINAEKAENDPEFQYNAVTHELRADRFSTYLELTEGFSPYRLDMVSGLRRDANQVFDPGFEPEYEPQNWTLLARMDDRGFFWECDGERLSTDQVIDAGLDALVKNVTR